MTIIEDIIATSIVLPSLPFANQLASAQTGTIAMSGATLIFFDGSNWKNVTAS